MGEAELGIFQTKVLTAPGLESWSAPSPPSRSGDARDRHQGQGMVPAAR